MIQVDDRIGSAELAPILRNIGCEVELTRLDYGDIAFLGWGANGIPVNIGLELKRLDDVIACVESGRFAGHQLPGLIQSYDHIWLLVCGTWYGREKDGVLIQKKVTGQGREYWSEAGGGRRRWMARDLESWFLTMMVMGGIRVHRVKDWREGAQWIKTVAHWFARDDHSSHKVLYVGKQLYPDQALLTKPSLARRLAAQLPGVSEVRSAAVAKHFHTLEALVSASERDWTKVDGFGKKLAQQVYKAIHQNGTGIKVQTK